MPPDEEALLYPAAQAAGGDEEALLYPTAPGKGDVAPPLTPAERTHPSLDEQQSAAQRADAQRIAQMEAVVGKQTPVASAIHGAGGLVPGGIPLAEGIAGALTPGDTFGAGWGRGQMKEELSRIKNPASFGLSRVGGGIVGTATMGPATVAGLTGTDTLARGGSVGDAALSAGLTYGLGKLATGAPGLARGAEALHLPEAAVRAAGVAGAARPGAAALAGAGLGGYGAATAPTTGDAIADATGAVLGLGGHAVARRASRFDRQATREFAPLRTAAEAELRAPIEPLVREDFQKQGMELRTIQQEHAKDYDKRVAEHQGAVASLDAELDAAKKSRLGEQKQAIGAAESVNADVDGALRDQSRAAADAEMLKKIGRERDYDFAASDVKQRNAANRAQYDTALGEFRAATDAAKTYGQREQALQRDAAGEANRLRAVSAEQAKAKVAFDKMTRSLEQELATLEAEQEGLGRSADASWAKLHPDTQAYIAGYLEISRLAGHEVPPALRQRMERVAGHLADTRESSAPTKLEAFESAIGKGKDQFREDYIRREGQQGAERIDRIEGEMKNRTAPTRDAAEKIVADKRDRSLSVEDKARLLEYLATKNGRLDGDTVRLNEPAPTLPAKPTLAKEAAPSRLPLREADRAAKERALTAQPSGVSALAERKGASIAPDLPPDVDARQFVKDREALVPDMPEAWKKPNPADPPTGDAARPLIERAVKQAIADESAKGRSDLIQKLKDAGVKPDVFAQWLAEQKAPSRARQAAGMAAGGALGAGIGGIPGAAIGAGAGTWLGSKLAAKPVEKVLPGAMNTPAKRAAGYGDIEAGLRRKSLLSGAAADKASATLSRAAIASILADPNIRRWLEEKRQ